MTLDEDQEVFENYYDCVYEGDLNPRPWYFFDYDENYEIDNSHLDALTKMWVLADKLIDTETANLVMDQIHWYCNLMDDFAGPDSFNLVYDSTVSDSPLRAFMCDLVIYEGGADFFGNEDSSEYHVEFYRDVAVRLIRITNENGKSSKTFKDVFGEGGFPHSHMPCSDRYHLRDPTPSRKR